MMLTIKQFSHIQPADWDQFLCENGWNWYSSRSAYVLRDSQDRLSFVVADKVRICACVHADIIHVEGYKILNILGIAVEQSVHRRQVLKLVGQRLGSIAESEKANEIWLHVPPLSNEEPSLAWHTSILCDLGFGSELPWGDGLTTHAGYYSVIDLSRPLESIKEGYSKSHRLAVNRGYRDGVAVYLHHGIAAVEKMVDFRLVLSETMRRGDGDDYPDIFYDRLIYMFCNGDAILCESISPKGGRAYIVLDRFGDKYNYYAGCQTDEYVRWSGIVHLHHETMRLLKEGGARLYGLGPIFPTLSGKMGAICEFKRRFGGVRFPFLCGRKIIDNEEHVRVRVVGRIFPTYRDLIKYAVGKVRRRYAS